MNNKEFRKMKILARAKQLVWDELDHDDKRVYLSEAEKLINKEDKERLGSEFEELEKLNKK